MKFYVLEESIEEKYAVNAIIHNMNMVTNFKTTLAVPLGDNFPTLDISIISYNLLPDFFHLGQFLIISESLKVIFESFCIDFEYYPVCIRNDHSLGYYYAHLLSEIDFIDREKSTYIIYDELPEYIEEVTDLKLKENMCFTLSRLKNCFDQRFFVINEEVANKLLENNIKGIVLKQL